VLLVRTETTTDDVHDSFILAKEALVASLERTYDCLVNLVSVSNRIVPGIRSSSREEESGPERIYVGGVVPTAIWTSTLRSNVGVIKLRRTWRMERKVYEHGLAKVYEYWNKLINRVITTYLP
jgi:hypothetical protein